MNLTAPLTDTANALEALALCEKAYSIPWGSGYSVVPEDQNFVTTDPDGTIHNGSSTAHVLIQPLENCILVCARGSEDAEDWLTDGRFNLIPTIYGQAHCGFWNSVDSIFSTLVTELAKFPPLPVVVVGHSLGGASARIIARRLCDINPIPVLAALITFGEPRGGDSDFAASCDKVLKSIHCRWVNALDIVPRVPCRFMGYAHSGQEAFLGSRSGKVELNPSVWELLTSDVARTWEGIRAKQVQQLTDHHAPAYRAALENIAQQSGK